MGLWLTDDLVVFSDWCGVVSRCLSVLNCDFRCLGICYAGGFCVAVSRLVVVVCVLWFVFASCGFLARFGCGAFWFMVLLFLVVAWCFDLVLLGALVFVGGTQILLFIWLASRCCTALRCLVFMLALDVASLWVWCLISVSGLRIG